LGSVWRVLYSVVRMAMHHGRPNWRCLIWIVAIAAPAIVITGARAQEAPGTSTGIEGITVTAQKQEQSTNSVGMSITAATGDTLRERGIDSVDDLTKLVPGFTVQQGGFNSTSFTLRGVGFFNSDLATPPAVTVYVDEAPLSYPAMTKLAAFDLERVEVLKGPQGTLFGENATGGTINYIAAKPTDTLQAGADANYGTFNRAQISGYVSGSLDDDLTGRLALQIRRGDPWQESVTRPGDRLGRILEIQSRGTLEWHPDEPFTSRLTLTITHDGSDSQASQFIAPFTAFPALAVPGLSTFPVVTKPRAADWTPVRPDTNAPFPYASNTTLYQASWRNDYALSENLSVTSLSSYAYFRLGYGQDQDGTPFHFGEAIDQNGRISSVFQELRLAGRQQQFNWLFGANYQRDSVLDQPLEFLSDNDAAHLFQTVDPKAYADESQIKGQMRAETYSAFGRVEFNITDTLTLEGAVRYNSDRRTFDNCAFIVTDHLARFENLARGGAPPTLGVGDCYIVDPANRSLPVTDVHNALNQDSVPWKAGLSWTPQPDLMIYANASRGFKAGAAAVAAAATTDQVKPVPQESLLAYEAGIKTGLFDHRVQLNSSLFYYDYKDKQLRGDELDPTFGPLEALVSIPKSHVEGAEAQLVAQPLQGLTIDTALTYVQTEIDQFDGFNAEAQFGDQSRTPFPFAPKWQTITNVDYKFPLSDDIEAFVGVSHTYDSKTYTGIGALNILRIDSYSLFDVRAGAEFENGKYRIWVWGKNITDKYFWTDAFVYGNTISRFAGQPATFGISLSGRF
jgi:iron complex outermembrane receptor protein